MEEIYVIKLKGLPANDKRQFATKNSIESKDLSREALFGCGLLQVFFGLLSILWYSIELLASWKSVIGILAGLLYSATGCIGFWASIRRKNKFIGSRRLVKMFLLASLTSFTICFLLISLTVAGLMCDRSINARIKTNIVITEIIETFFAALSIFTSIRILWPSRLLCCAKSWPQRKKIKRKVIVATSIFAHNLPANSDYITRYLGPNCIVSMAAQRAAIAEREHTPEDLNENIYENCVYSDIENRTESSDYEIGD